MFGMKCDDTQVEQVADNLWEDRGPAWQPHQAKPPAAVALESTSGCARRHLCILSILVRFCSDCGANPFSSSFLSHRVAVLE
jgi:hypothetical protein